MHNNRKEIDCMQYRGKMPIACNKFSVHIFLQERKHLCPPAGVQLQPLSTNKTVRMTVRDIEVLPDRNIVARRTRLHYRYIYAKRKRLPKWVRHSSPSCSCNVSCGVSGNYKLCLEESACIIYILGWWNPHTKASAMSKFADE